MKWMLIFILLSTFAAAQTISDYPSFLVWQNFYLIKGDIRNLQEIAAANALSINLPVNQYQIATSTKFASEVSIIDRPSIIVGTPCNNRWIAELLELSDCRVIPPTDGIVIVGFEDDLPVVIVTGGSPAAVFNAAKWLSSGSNKGHYSNFVRITKSGSYSRIYIGNGDLLQIGQPISQVTPVIIIGSQKLKGTSANAYLRIGDGRVIFGKNN